RTWPGGIIALTRTCSAILRIPVGLTAAANLVHPLPQLFDAEAEPLYQKALAICEQRLGTEHPNTVTARNNLEYLRNNMG
ncbi:MAG: tetratricopeptide repeat protein, partial [Cyanobacteria bacterium P01_A01_bin.68]